MQRDFHYYGTYCAASLAGYSHEESMAIAYSAELVDHCSRSFLAALKAPLSAATTQLAFEMANARTDILGLQDITRIWASFHFLPYDLNREVGKGGRRYRNKYRLICDTNGPLLKETVRLAKGKGLQAAGLAVHVLADTWAHRYFAGTPSLVINNMSRNVVELVTREDGSIDEQPVKFRNSLSGDDLSTGIFTCTPTMNSENTIMNLGHGRAGHLPDYSFARYKYLPAWAEYHEILKDNPSDYYRAFCQMVYALSFLHGNHETFETERYDTSTVAPWEDRIRSFLVKRQLDIMDEWHALATSITGRTLEDFSLDKYQQEYLCASPDEKNDTFLGKFILAALEQKGMVTNKIYSSGNPLAGRSIEYREGAFAGMKDYLVLISDAARRIGRG